MAKLMPPPLCLSTLARCPGADPAQAGETCSSPGAALPKLRPQVTLWLSRFATAGPSCCLEQTAPGLLALWPPGIPAKLGLTPTLLPPVTLKDLFVKGAMVAMDTRQKPSLGARNVEMGFFLCPERPLDKLFPSLSLSLSLSLSSYLSPSLSPSLFLSLPIFLSLFLILSISLSPAPVLMGEQTLP